MSARVMRCVHCQHECVSGGLDGLIPFPPEREESYGVSWTCPACGDRALDVCNLGPLAPTPTSCLNCGEDYRPDAEGCPGCGLTRAECDTFLHLPERVGPEGFRLTQQAFKQGLFQHGMALLNRMLQADYSLLEAWLVKLEFYQRLGFLRAAQTMCGQALARSAPADLWVYYAGVLSDQGADRQAVTAYQNYIDTGPKDLLALAIAASEQGNALARIQDFASSERAHQRAIATKPDWALLYLNYGDLFIRQRRWDEAEQMLDTGLQHAAKTEDRLPLLEAKGHVLAYQRRPKESLACIDHALALGSDSSRAHHTRGRALAQLGRLEESRAAFERSLALNPNNESAKEAIQQIDDALRNG